MQIDETKLAAAFALFAEALRSSESAPSSEPAEIRTETPPTTEPASNVVTMGAQAMYGAPPISSPDPTAAARWDDPEKEPISPPAEKRPNALPPPTKDELSLAARALWQDTGDDSIVPDLLARFGVAGLKDLPEKHYAQFLKDIQEANDAG